VSQIHRYVKLAAFSALLLVVAACEQAVEAEQLVLEEQLGMATYYGERFHGRATASGEIFDMNDMVAAHPSYPAGTVARVTNLENGRDVEVRIIDRGPTRQHQRRGVIIDVSKGAAEELDFIEDGRVRVRVEVLEWGAD
jgi:rare lipoprotein A